MTAVSIRKDVPAEKPDPLAELRDVEAITKSTVAFMKHAESNMQRAWNLVKDAHHASGIVSFVEYTSTDEGMDICKLYDGARRLYLEGPGSAIAKQAEPVIEKLEKEIAKSVGGFAVAHNLDELKAILRLREISSSFRDLESQHADAHKVRTAAIGKAKALADSYHIASQKQAERVVTETAESDARIAKRAVMVPSEATLMEKAEKLAAEKRIPLSKAVVQLTTEDAEGIKLAADAARERAHRMAGIR